MLGIMGRGSAELRSVVALSCVTVLLLLELSPKHGTRSVNKRWLFCCYRSAIDLTFCDLVWSVSVESRRSLKHTAWDFRAKTLQNHELNMSEEGAEATAPAQDQNQGFFTSNIMNSERPKFDSRQENRRRRIESLQKEM